MRSQTDKDFILAHTDSPYSIENCMTEQDIEELIDIWEDSDNKEYDPYIISNYDILEIWESIAFFSKDFPNPNNEYSSIKNHINNLYSNLDDLKKKL